MKSNIKLGTKQKKSKVGQYVKRGRLAFEEWQLRARYVLRHLDDPIDLQRSPLCRLVALERLAKDGQLMAYRHESFWQCMDTLREKYILESLWQSGKAPWKIWED